VVQLVLDGARRVANGHSFRDSKHNGLKEERIAEHPEARIDGRDGDDGVEAAGERLGSEGQCQRLKDPKYDFVRRALERAVPVGLRKAFRPSKTRPFLEHTGGW
jgi:hypothetical protein